MLTVPPAASYELLFLIISALLASLLTMLVGQVGGMRKDMKEFLNKITDISDRLIVIETEHEHNQCKKASCDERS